ncbi:MAG: hypothetical protein GY797_28330 [Deltaproteobacteria bacterium]|nr:hypothetical protein [Deltaproteobacteria bacterium]
MGDGADQALERAAEECELFDKLYRCNVFSTTISDEISFTEYDIVKRTSKGYWVKENIFDSDMVWVSDYAKKRLCYPTKEEAVNNLYYRRLRYKRILNARLKTTDIIIRKCEELLNGNKGRSKTKDRKRRGLGHSILSGTNDRR